MESAEFWQQRFIQYHNQARALQVKTLELVAIGLTAVSALAGVAVSYSRYEFFAFIPIICVLLWAVAARMLHEHLLLSAYRDFCEAKAARFLPAASGTAFDTWQSLGGRVAMRGMANYYAFGIIALITLGLAGGSLAFLLTLDVVPQGWIIAESVAVGLAFIVGGVVFVVSMADHAALETRMAQELP